MNHLLRQFSIRTRMMGAIAMVLALLALVGGAGLLGMQKVAKANDRFLNGTYLDQMTVSTLRAAMGDMRRSEKDLLLSLPDQAKVVSHQTQWRTALDLVQSSAKKLVASGDGDEGAKLAAEVDKRLGTYATLVAPVVAKLAKGEVTDVAQANQLLGAAKAEAHDAEKAIEHLVKHLEDERSQVMAERDSVVAQSYWIFGVVLGLAVLLVVPLTLANMTSICEPINRARHLAESIAVGNLANQIDADGLDETSQLLKSLDVAQTALRQIVGQVRESAESIQMASSEVASGNADLSHRTEQAAANLQQTASSMEQLTGTVRQTSDAASQANQLASSASAVAQRGGQVVSQVVTTMDEINHSSKRIADIIGTIDGIAFQTNILALNAAVEAARAGEQGRGFAVVAGEVRNLAQRSADAAREIKGLITTSVERVDTGARLVQDAGATMNEIVASVQRVTDIIGEITAAATEQTSGMSQVNGAVATLDQMTQQNAALVEQSAAAAESLRDQASRMSGVVAKFQLH